MPTYAGRHGALPPLAGEEPIRQGSAPTDGANPRGGLRDSQNQGDYYTVVHAGSNSGSQKDGKSQSTRAQAVPLEGAKQGKVETVAEHPNEDAQGDTSPKAIPATTESAEPAMAAKNVETIGSAPDSVQQQ